jgi:hypothetical protein
MSNIDFCAERLRQRPTESDAVLGNQNLVSPGSVILGGIEGVKKRLNSESIHIKILAMKDAMNYGDAGLQLAIEYLEDEELQIVEAAYSLLESRPETFVRERIQRYLDDRELEIQDMKYSWLESSPEAIGQKQIKTTKESKHVKNPKTHSRSISTPSTKRWGNAS